MEDWVWWVIAAGGLAVGEIFTMGILPGADRHCGHPGGDRVARGRRAGGELGRLHRGLGRVALVLRPIARRHLRTPPRIRTGTAALVGGPATVVERVDGDGGCVKIGGNSGRHARMTRTPRSSRVPTWRS